MARLAQGLSLKGGFTYRGGSTFVRSTYYKQANDTNSDATQVTEGALQGIGRVQEEIGLVLTVCSRSSESRVEEAAGGGQIE
jgi:hypothetical protein